MLEILTQIAALLVISFFLKELADRLKIPFIVLLVLGGTLAATYGVVDIKSLGPLPDMIRTLALIIIVFSSAFYLNLDEIKKHSKSIIMLSTIGVLLSTLLITTTTLYLLPIPLITAAFLGALLSGTDAAALTTALPKKASDLADVIRAESLFNSPFTVILPLLLLDFVKIPEMALLNIPKLFLLIIVGVCVGIITGYAGKKLLEQAKTQHAEAIGLVIALSTYVLAENLLGSGIMAVAICSLILSTMNIEKKYFLGEFNSELAFLSTMFVFMLLGAQFVVDDLFFTREEIFAVIIALIFARLLTALVILYHSEFSIADRIKIGLIAPKGVSPAALAPLVLAPALGIIGAESIVKITYFSIIISTLISLIVLKITISPETEQEKTGMQVEEKRVLREKKKDSKTLLK